MAISLVGAFDGNQVTGGGNFQSGNLSLGDLEAGDLVFIQFTFKRNMSGIAASPLTILTGASPQDPNSSFWEFSASQSSYHELFRTGNGNDRRERAIALFYFVVTADDLTEGGIIVDYDWGGAWEFGDRHSASITAWRGVDTGSPFTTVTSSVNMVRTSDVDDGAFDDEIEFTAPDAATDFAFWNSTFLPGNHTIIAFGAFGRNNFDADSGTTGWTEAIHSSGSTNDQFVFNSQNTLLGMYRQETTFDAALMDGVAVTTSNNTHNSASMWIVLKEASTATVYDESVTSSATLADTVPVVTSTVVRVFSESVTASATLADTVPVVTSTVVRVFSESVTASTTLADTVPVSTGPVKRPASTSSSATFADTTPTATETVSRVYSESIGASATLADTAPSSTFVTTFAPSVSVSASFAVTILPEVTFVPTVSGVSSSFATTPPTAVGSTEEDIDRSVTASASFDETVPVVTTSVIRVFSETTSASASVEALAAEFATEAEAVTSSATFETTPPEVSFVATWVKEPSVSATATGTSVGAWVHSEEVTASAEFQERLVEADVTLARVGTAGAEASVSAPTAQGITTAPVVSLVVTATVTATPTRVTTASTSASLAAVSSVTSPAVSVSKKAIVDMAMVITVRTNVVTKVPISATVTATNTVSRSPVVTVSSTMVILTSNDGGSTEHTSEAASQLSISASTEVTSGSVYHASIVIDGIGSVVAPLVSTRAISAIIDGIGSISADLLLGANIVTIEEIWNVALVELGVTTVQNATTDGTPQAVLLRTVWNGGFRQQFLADSSFGGSKSTATLSFFKDSSDTNVNPGGTRWNNAFLLPTDYIRALTINGLPMQPNTSMGKNQWEIEIVGDGETPETKKRCLVTNVGSVDLEYIMDIGNDNLSLLSPLVAHAAGLALASHVAVNFGKSPTEQAQIQQRAADALLSARGVDGQESSPRLFSTTGLLDVRR
tara:strand:+ start:146 stop:3022 length:2877 start_codon:yes stop_codon:yes gene_type:complete